MNRYHPGLAAHLFQRLSFQTTDRQFESCTAKSPTEVSNKRNSPLLLSFTVSSLNERTSSSDIHLVYVPHYLRQRPLSLPTFVVFRSTKLLRVHVATMCALRAAKATLLLGLPARRCALYGLVRRSISEASRETDRSGHRLLMLPTSLPAKKTKGKGKLWMLRPLKKSSVCHILVPT